MDLNLQVVEDFNLSPLFQVASQTLLRNQQELAAKREKEDKQRAASQKEMAGLISKVNPAGLRPKDVAKFNDLTSQMRDAAISAMNASDSESRLQGEAKVQELHTQVMYHSEASKEMAKQELALGTRLADMDADEEDINRYKTLQQTPLDDIPVGAMNPINWAKPPDFTYANGVIENTLKDLLKNVDTELNIGDRVNIAGRSGQEYGYVGELPPEVAGAALMQLYEYDRKFKKSIDSQFKDVSPEEAIMTIVAQKKEDGKLTSRDKKMQWTPVQRSSDGGSGSSSASAPGEVIFNRGMTIAGQQFSAERSIGANIKSVTLPISTAIDRETGELVNLETLIEAGVNTGNISTFISDPSFAPLLNGETEVALVNVTYNNPKATGPGSQFRNAPKTITKQFYIGADVLPTSGTNGKVISTHLNKLRTATTGTEATSSRVSQGSVKSATRSPSGSAKKYVGLDENGNPIFE
jgi:hypothetical protein